MKELTGSRDGTVVRALLSHQCVQGLISGPSVICGSSLLLILYCAPGGFSLGTLVFPSPHKPTFLNSNLILTIVKHDKGCRSENCDRLLRFPLYIKLL